MFIMAKPIITFTCYFYDWHLFNSLALTVICAVTTDSRRGNPRIMK